jgi:hypothetical protein
MRSSELDERICENRGCNRSLAGKSKRARFCGDDCKKEAWKERLLAPQGEAFWSGCARILRRRPPIRSER